MKAKKPIRRYKPNDKCFHEIDYLLPYRCPKCKTKIRGDYYCDHCGQKLDWREENE